MVWNELIGKELNDRELDNLNRRFNTDGFYCRLKNPLEYTIGLQDGDKEHHIMDVSRDRIMTFEYNMQTLLTRAEVSLVAHKLELIRPKGLEEVIKNVNGLNKSREQTPAYAPQN